MHFWLGTHKPHWLRQVDIPLFVSRRTLSEIKKLPRALAPWALDSGAFSELDSYGTWRTTPAVYLDQVKRFADEVGLLAWASCQDWMCEPYILEQTGLTVAEHQARTIDSYIWLKAAMPDFPWVPVLQGYRKDEYLRHFDCYISRGVDLTTLPLVGVGSVCRRQATREAVHIIQSLAGRGLKLHGFGFKIKGLEAGRSYLVSADSLAWGYHARRRPPLAGCVGHRNCANCVKYALRWRRSLLSGLEKISF